LVTSVAQVTNFYRLPRGKWVPPCPTVSVITHQGKQILLIDLSYGSATEVEEVLRAFPDVVTARPGASVLILSDFTGASFGQEAIRVMKETAVFDKPYSVKKSAWRDGRIFLVITINSTVIGHREREVRDGMEQLLRGNIWSRIPFAPQVLARPRWLTRFLVDGGLPDMPNIVSAETGVLRVRDAHTAMKRELFSWDDMQWIRALWKGPIVIKGVLSADDAKRSLDHGAAAVVVSNHGGRQLDGVPASLQVLPEVVAAVKDQAEVLMDSGIRRGSDIAKALCMGARAVLCGRAFAYGLAAGGEAGVARAIEMLRSDLERCLKLLGCRSVDALNESYLQIASHC
jgi:isopentenyl diphosphate isomerase/L-lactate dehydrogenase-like FMN-dependent dehydrogenase